MHFGSRYRHHLKKQMEYDFKPTLKDARGF